MGRNTDGTVPTQLTFEAERITERYRESLWPQEQESFAPGLFRPYSFPSWRPGRELDPDDLDVG